METEKERQEFVKKLGDALNGCKMAIVLIKGDNLWRFWANGLDDKKEPKWEWQKIV